MAQFDVHENQNPDDPQDFPYLLDIQSDLLDQLQSRVVVPLMPVGRFGDPIARLNPVFEIHGDRYVGVFNELAAINRSELGVVVGSLSGERHDIIAAIDFLMLGF